MLLEGETRRICDLAGTHGIQLLLLKGTALAHWLYEEPHLRASSDVDLLLQDEPQARNLAELLVNRGYRWVSSADPLVGFELLCVHDVAPGISIEIDIHWSIGCTPVFSQALPFAELWSRSISIPRLGPDARGLSAADALAHACIARISDLANDAGESLKTLYDISLLSGQLHPETHEEVVQRAKARHLSGTMALGLEAAEQAFGLAPACHDLLAKLKQNAPAEPFEASRLTSWRYMQVHSLLAVPGLLPKLRWIKHRLLPNREQLDLYPENRGSYLRRIINRLTTERRRTPQP